MARISRKDRLRLYKAVKYTSHEFYVEHGLNMVEMWKACTKGNTLDKWFWQSTCIGCYEHNVERRYVVG